MILFLFLLFFQSQELKIEDLKQGNAPAAQYGDSLTVHYTGWLFNKTTPFESSYGNEAIHFVLGKENVIKGWELGLVGAQVGTKRKLTIPPHLAYGDADSPVIPAQSTLVFDIEILEIKAGPRPLVIPKSAIKHLRDKVEFYDIKIGQGKKVTAETKVRYHYRLFNKNKVLLFSTYDFQPEEMNLSADDHLIKGFQNGLIDMQVGTVRTLYCEGPFNTPEDTFIYEVEVLEIK